MDFANGGDLSSLIKEHCKYEINFDEDDILTWMMQICKAL